MAKIKLIQMLPWASFNNYWLTPLVDCYFDLEPWDSEKTYEKNSIFYINTLRAQKNPAEIYHLTSQGYKVIVDNLWERNVWQSNNFHTMYCPDWFWYNESLWYHCMGYANYVPQKNNVKYLGFMPMWGKRKERTEFLNRIDKTRMLWSYVAEGHLLPNDADVTDPPTQRHFNPEWYDQSYLSMVVETLGTPTVATPTFVTEKTFKPMAFRHPFIVFGDQHTLKLLREWGFETYDNLWDESYDQFDQLVDRQEAILQILQTTQIQEYDLETQRRIEHNWQQFFNKDLVTQRIIEKVIEPIIEYAET